MGPEEVGKFLISTAQGISGDPVSVSVSVSFV